MAKKQVKHNDKPAVNLALLDGRTPKEAAENLRKEARRMENYRNRPEVRRAIARDPKILAMVIDLERKAAALLEEADKLESELGDMNAAEFAALNARADEWAMNNPEEAARMIRDAGTDTVQKGVS